MNSVLEARPGAVREGGSGVVAQGRERRPPRRIAVEGAVPTRAGMKFDTRMPFDQWVVLGARLGTHADASLWWLGDWLDFGRDMFGRRYKDGIELTGLDYQTLRNYASVARRYRMSRRRDRLSFQHHAELCALSDEEQDVWLNRAEEGRWSRNELRRQRRAERLGNGAALPEIVVRMTVEADRQERWWQAAAHSDCELQAWIVSTLDQAADELLADGAPPS